MYYLRNANSAGVASWLRRVRKDACGRRIAADFLKSTIEDKACDNGRLASGL